MSGLRVNALRGETTGSSPTFPDGVVASGVVTSTTFSGNLTGNVIGNISGTTGSFSGDVSIGGTLTYEDVTNVDSVGVVTARSGIRVGAGQSISAVSGTLTYYGDGSQLTGVSAGGESDFVASGAIANGQTVILKTDGTVEVVSQSTSYVGNAVSYESGSGSANQNAAVYDYHHQKVVIAYQDAGDSSKGKAVVGAISGNTINFGSPVEFAANLYSEPIGAAFDPDQQKVIFSYRDQNNGNYGTAIVGNVSSTTISFGSPQVFNSANTPFSSLSYDTTNDKLLIAYGDFATNTGRALVATISGTSISYGSPSTFNSGTTYYVSSIWYPVQGRHVIVYRDDGNSYYGTVVAATISSNSVSFGSEQVFKSASTTHMTCAYDSNSSAGRVIIAYNDGGNNGYGTVRVGTLSGTTFTFGNEVVFNSGTTYYTTTTYDPTNSKVVISYGDAGKGSTVIGTISGNNISVGSETEFFGSGVSWTSSAYDSNTGKVIIAFANSGGKAVVWDNVGSSTTNLTAENYIGIAAEAISDTATGKINILGGTNTGQTGLTAAKTYYVQPDGTLATSAGSPSVVAGTSISDTKILIR